MSFSVRSICPHGRGVFAWLGGGPWTGDPADPDHGRYAWVHDTSVSPGHLEVCDRMPFASAEEAGEVCACGHPALDHRAAPGPLPSGMIAKRRPCACGCTDFRRRPEDIERHRERGPGRHRERARPVAAPRAVAVVPLPAQDVQLDLFGGAA